MSMWRFLPLFVRTKLSNVWRHTVIRRFEMRTWRSVGQNLKRNTVAAGVVGGEKEFASAVEKKVAGILAQCRKLLNQRQVAAFLLHRKRADHALLACLVCRIEELPVRMDHNPRRVF